MNTLKVGDYVRTRYAIKLIREGVDLPAGSVGMVSSVVSSDAGYVRIGDNYVFFHASDLDANCAPALKKPIKTELDKLQGLTDLERFVWKNRNRSSAALATELNRTEAAITAAYNRAHNKMRDLEINS